MTGVYTSEEVFAALRRVLNELRRFFPIQGDHFVVSVSGKPVIHTRMQTLFNLKFRTVLEKTLYEVMLTHAMAAERLGPGGFSRSLELLLEEFDGRPGNKPILPFEQPHVPNLDELDALILRYASSSGSDVVSMLQKALRLAGFAGRIVVEKTTSAIPSVELVRGYTFELQQLLPADVSILNPKVVCIDGYVESVSEIHHLLEAASSAKEPVLLFLRGLSDDVKHTLKVNYDRGSLRVIPVAVRFDLEGMNTLIDISVVAGCDLISSLKGDLISSIKFDELPHVEQITLFKGRTVITNKATSRRVKQHLSELRKRRADIHLVEDVGKLLDKRIKSLSPSLVVIRLPDDKNYVIKSQSIDYALRAIRSAIEHGLNSVGVPATVEIASQVHVSRCLKTLNDIGAFVQT